MTDTLLHALQVILLVSAWVILTLIVFQGWWTIHTGRFAASFQDPAGRSEHRASRRKLLWLFIAEVVLAGILSRWPASATAERATAPQPLLDIHLALDACLVLIVLLIALRFSGERSPDLHRKWVYRGFVPLSAAVIVTGGMLLYWLM